MNLANPPRIRSSSSMLWMWILLGSPSPLTLAGSWGGGGGIGSAAPPRCKKINALVARYDDKYTADDLALPTHPLSVLHSKVHRSGPGHHCYGSHVSLTLLVAPQGSFRVGLATALSELKSEYAQFTTIPRISRHKDLTLSPALADKNGTACSCSPRLCHPLKSDIVLPALIPRASANACLHKEN